MVVAVPQRPIESRVHSKVIVWSDDDLGIRHGMSLILEDRGFHNVYWSPTVQGTLHLVQRLKPDLVVTDMCKGRADVTGADIARAIRSEPALAHTFIALWTGYDFRPEWYPLFDAMLLKGQGCDIPTIMRFIRDCLEAADRAR